MTNRPPLTGRAVISLLLVLSCAVFPMIRPKQAASDSSKATIAYRAVTRRPETSGPEKQVTQFKALPLRFELNAGQADPEVRFISRSQSGTTFLTPSEMVLCVPGASQHRVKTPGFRRYASEQASASTNSAVVRLRTVNASPNPRIIGLEPLPGKTNYFIGNDPKKWHTNVPSYARVKYENVYPGIDLIYYGKEGNLEYDFNVGPGADPKQIVLSIEGGDGVNIDDAGNLVLRTAVGEVSQHAPHIYQQDRAGRHEVAGGYVLRQNGLVAFDLAAYDANKPLVIDPELVYATYFGGSMGTDINGIAVDSAGSVYVVGDTFAHDFPTQNPIQPMNNHSNFSAIVTKFSPDGGSLVYSTYLGGSRFGTNDFAFGIVLDSTGAAYVIGATNSTDFPTRKPLQPALGGSEDVFIAKIGADGSTLAYSTYLGGSGEDDPTGITLDASNDAVVYGTTSSSNFPTINPTQAAYGGGTSDGFWSVISADGSQLLFSTYVGGNARDNIEALAINPSTGDVYLSGQTYSSDFAGNDGSHHTYAGYFTRLAAAGLTDVSADPSLAESRKLPLGSIRIRKSFSAEINPQQDSERWKGILGGFLGGPGGGLGGILAAGAEDSAKDGLIFFALPHETIRAVEAEKRGTFTVEPQASEIEAFLSGGCAFLPPDTTCSGLAASLMLDANTLVIKSITNIANPMPHASAMVRDSQDAIYLTGGAPTNPLFPLVNPLQSAGGGGTDAFVTVLAPVTRQIVFSTYLGGSGNDFSSGIALDPQGNIYIAGGTASSNFPTKNAYQSTPPSPIGNMIGQGGNGFIVKISSLGQIQVGPDFSLSFNQSTVTAQAGTKARITVNINRTGGFTGNVTVTPARPGGGIKPKPADPITTTDSSATFKMKIGGAVAPGPYQLTFTGTDDSGHTRTATVTLNVQ